MRYGNLVNRSVNALSDRSVENKVGVRLKLNVGGWNAVMTMKYGGNRAITSTIARMTQPTARMAPRCKRWKTRRVRSVSERRRAGATAAETVMLEPPRRAQTKVRDTRWPGAQTDAGPRSSCQLFATRDK